MRIEFGIVVNTGDRGLCLKTFVPWVSFHFQLSSCLVHTCVIWMLRISISLQVFSTADESLSSWFIHGCLPSIHSEQWMRGTSGAAVTKAPIPLLDTVFSWASTSLPRASLRSSSTPEVRFHIQILGQHQLSPHSHFKEFSGDWETALGHRIASWKVFQFIFIINSHVAPVVCHSVFQMPSGLAS